MKAQGTVKGILIQGGDGVEYLLGFSVAGRPPTPILSRRQADGTFSAVEEGWEASRVPTQQLGISGPLLIGPGMGKSPFLWIAFEEALKAFPPVPTWPTWS
jgi:hypothetical protein